MSPKIDEPKEGHFEVTFDKCPTCDKPQNKPTLLGYFCESLHGYKEAEKAYDELMAEVKKRAKELGWSME